MAKFKTKIVRRSGSSPALAKAKEALAKTRSTLAKVRKAPAGDLVEPIAAVAVGSLAAVVQVKKPEAMLLYGVSTPLVVGVVGAAIGSLALGRGTVGKVVRDASSAALAIGTATQVQMMMVKSMSDEERAAYAARIREIVEKREKRESSQGDWEDDDQE